jgi:hypothetical protein
MLIGRVIIFYSSKNTADEKLTLSAINLVRQPSKINPPHGTVLLQITNSGWNSIT